MTQATSLRSRILAGETLFGTFLNMASVQAAEISARAGLDWVLVDLEHGSGTEADLLPQLAAIASTGATALVRVEEGTRLRIGRVLDLGADGVMVPQVVERGRGPRHRGLAALPARGQARRGAVHAWPRLRHRVVTTRSTAATSRSWASSRSSPAAGVEAAAEMAAIDGVDVLFVGPADLTHALGIRGQVGPSRLRGRHPDRGGRRASHGKAAGIMLWKPEDAARYAALGYTFFSLSTDGALLNAAVRGSVQAGRAAISSR